MKAVVFDLDNTLFDHTASSTAALHGWVAGSAVQRRTSWSRSGS